MHGSKIRSLCLMKSPSKNVSKFVIYVYIHFVKNFAKEHFINHKFIISEECGFWITYSHWAGAIDCDYFRSTHTRRRFLGLPKPKHYYLPGFLSLLPAFGRPPTSSSKRVEPLHENRCYCQSLINLLHTTS